MLNPGARREYDLIRGAGLDVWVHSCGDIRAIMPDLTELGADVLNPVQPECMDIFRAEAALRKPDDLLGRHQHPADASIRYAGGGTGGDGAGDSRDVGKRRVYHCRRAGDTGRCAFSEHLHACGYGERAVTRRGSAEARLPNEYCANENSSDVCRGCFARCAFPKPGAERHRPHIPDTASGGRERCAVSTRRPWAVRPCGPEKDSVRTAGLQFRRFFLYSDGDMPNFLLNARESVKISRKPLLSAISDKDLSVLSRSSFTRDRRYMARY